MIIQMTLYFFVEKNLTRKFITMSCQRCFETSNKIKTLLILSRDTLFLQQKLQLEIYFSIMFFKRNQ